ncbi:MAG TPA: DUF5715 family protein [Pyrinomonadaceae bacterium]|nr:DUF5715 family protein [Pyrinomonadaceae bacterium]
MKERKAHPTLLIAGTLFVALILMLILMPLALKRRAQSSFIGLLMPAPANAEAAEVSSWTQAVRKVKEDRGEPVGSKAKVDTPPQLRQYSDRRRFLAVQVAEQREHQLETPRDFVDLAAMLKGGEMVELQPLTHDYILFGVGGNADPEPFTRYENGERVPLYDEAGLEQAYDEIAQSRETIENEINGLKKELNSLNRRERSARTRLQNEISDREKALKAAAESKELLDRNYVDAAHRQKLFNEYASLENIADDFQGERYDIEDARSRRELKVRMLSSLRPEALKILEEVASAYRERFDRPLPVSSLVRPLEYQQALSRVNPNATRIETPPHSTGLAFDINYSYMSAEEQSYVMDCLARLKDEGRIEVLRENRDNYHVFAFLDGVAPNDTFIRASLNAASPAGRTKEAETSE